VKQIFTLLLLILISLITFSQENNVKLVSFESSECCTDYPSEREIRTRIISQEFVDDFLIIKIATIANCSGINNIQLAFENDSLFLNYQQGEIEYDTISIDTLDWNGTILYEINEYTIFGHGLNKLKLLFPYLPVL